LTAISILPQDKCWSLGLKFKPTLGICQDSLPQVAVMVNAHAWNWIPISVNDDTLNM
jgi:hypothetical protein